MVWVVKSQKIPSDKADAVVVAVSVNRYAIKSPGNNILSILPYSSGSCSFTQANFAAVKLPGEFNRCVKHFALPIFSKAASP